MIKITYLGHASFKIESKDGVIITDPYQDNSVPGLKFPSNQVCDFLFISHEHHDHNARELVTVRDGRTLSYLEHMAPHDKNGGKERGLTKFFIFYVEGLKIAHLGDMCDITIQKNIEYLKNIDILLVPINNYYTMGPDEAKTLCDAIKPKLVIPMHYRNIKNQSGYEDGNQIERFKNYFPNYIEVNEVSINVDDYLNKYEAVIFNNCLQ